MALLLSVGAAGPVQAVMTNVSAGSHVVNGLTLSLAAPEGSAGKLTAEIASLQAELAKKTAEISALKRAQRGVRDDYQLRRRMAEANDVARRLTALESELSGREGNGTTGGAGNGKTPATQPAAAADSASVLAARADLLSDEARKLSQRATGMVQAAGQLRARQALRRRAFNVERDAFAGLDGARRVVPVRPAAAASPNGRGSTEVTTGGPVVGDNVGAPGSTTPSPTGGNSPSQTSPPGLAGPPSPPPSGGPPATTGAAQTTPPPAPPSSPPVSQPNRGADPKAEVVGPTAGPTKNELAPGALIDPSLRAELARLEASGGGGTDADSLLRAAAALTTRAQSLEAEAKTLRERAARR